MTAVVSSHPVGMVELFISGVGRIGRTTFVLAMVVVQSAFEFYQHATPLWLKWATGWAAYPILMCMAASVLSKRLHDVGRAGWWSALPILAYPLIRPWPEGLVGGIAFGIVLWFAAWLALQPGEARFNRFGERG